jgi:hypothetical protein
VCFAKEGQRDPFFKQFRNFTTRLGLYRVWVPLHDDGTAPLISIWIDPTMTTFEQEQGHEEIGPSGVSDSAIAEKIEDSMRPTGVAPEVAG